MVTCGRRLAVAGHGMKRTTALLGSITLVFCFCVFNAKAQTAEETVAYINSKITGKETTFAAYDLRLDQVQLKNSVFIFAYTRTDDWGTLGRPTSFFEEAIDLTKVEDFTLAFTTRLMKAEENVIRLNCGRGHGNCALRRTCGSIGPDGKCEGTQSENISTLHLDISPLSSSDEETRVKKAVVHLKSLFPFKENIELFDR